MKKILFTALAVMLIGAVAYGQTSVLSRNAVGYVRLDFTGGSYSLIANNWNKVAAGGVGLSIQDLLDVSNMKKTKSFLTADNLIMWDPYKLPAGGYKTFYLYDSPGDPNWDRKWVDTTTGELATNVIKSGEAFWIVNRAASNVTSYCMGEVPSAPTNVHALVAQRFNMFSPGYTYDMMVNDTNLSWAGGKKTKSFLTADNLLIWDAGKPPKGGYYTLYLYDSASDPAWDNKWVDVATGTLATNVLKVGQGVWYVRRDVTTFNWAEKRPYTWPKD